MDRITDKSKGKAIVSDEKEEEKGGEVIDIMEALRRSLEGGRAPARRAPAREEKPAAKARTARARTTSKKRKAS
jgi:DNA end-binding protein Ku